VVIKVMVGAIPMKGTGELGPYRWRIIDSKLWAWRSNPQRGHGGQFTVSPLGDCL
jgi:hypothetical protein